MDVDCLPLDIRLLGPVEVRLAGRPLPLNRRRERLLLAVLASQRGQVVPLGRIIDLLWDDQPPPAAGRLLHSHVSRLRAALRPVAEREVALVRHTGGYELRVPEACVDICRFRALTGRARDTADPADRRELLDEALRMWRGPVFADLATDPRRWPVAAELDELRLSALESRLDADLSLGRYEEVIGELRAYTAEHPVRARPTMQLMRALYQIGRAPEALDLFDQHRAQLADRLGVDPEPEVRRLHTAILRSEPLPGCRPPAVPTGPGGAAGGGTGAAAVEVPTQLPAGPGTLRGRDTVLARLDQARRATGTPVPVVVTGPAGVGKTALAVHWARQVIDDFPDGQLFIDLAGHGDGTALQPADALLHALQSLGVGAERIPADLGGRSALYRSVLARRRVLVVLDNAANAEQVVPLLPGPGTGHTLITSRRRLEGLSMHRAVEVVDLDVLPRAEAVALLGELDTASRTDPTGTRPRRRYAQLAACCGDLPLALQIIGAKLRLGWPPDLLAAELAVEERRLDQLAAEADSGGVRTTLHWSYRRLSPASARAFRFLAAHPGPVWHGDHLRVLTGGSAGTAAGALLELADAHLIVPTGEGWYRFHDLVRLFAGERLREEEPARARRDAVDRLIDWYERLAAAANSIISPHRTLVTLPAQAGDPTQPGRMDELMARLDREWPNIRPVAALAVGTGRDLAVTRLNYFLNGYLARRDKWHDAIHLGRLARRATERLGDRRIQAATTQNIGIAMMMLHRHRESVAYFRAALRRREPDDWTGRARVWSSIGAGLDRQGDHEGAVDAFQRALALLANQDAPHTEAIARNNLAWVYTKLGRYDEAMAELRVCQRLAAAHRDRQTEATTLLHVATVELAGDRLDEAAGHLTGALELARAAHCRYTEAEVFGTLSEIARRRGRHDEAAAHLVREITMRRAAGNRHAETVALTKLGRVRLDAGEPAAARTAFEEALALCQGTPDSTQERLILEALAEITS